MTRLESIDTETLVDEIVRYLAAVDVFRSCGCAPSWRPELVPSAVQLRTGTPGSQRAGAEPPQA
jgi:hypothetical protein